MGERKKYALAGTGSRASYMFAKPLLTTYADKAEIVGAFDTNSARMAAFMSHVGYTGPIFSSFQEMLEQSNPDCLIVASMDCTHADYVVKALQAGKRVYVEKPLCTTAAQCREILAATRKSPGLCLVTHNMRYGPASTSIRSILHEGRIGKPLFVQFHEMLDRSHGADYFRRWHRRMTNSGGLQIHKASHHFDVLNWWIGSKPKTVQALGALRVYGANSPYRGKRCLGCAEAGHCPFFVDYTKIDVYKKYYFDAEHVDGYMRDACVFDPSIDIQDQLSANIRYENGVDVVYSLAAHAAYEGMNVIIDGTLGRLEQSTVIQPSEQAALGIVTGKSQRLIIPGQGIIDVPLKSAKGDHGGADPALRDDFFGRDWSLPPNEQMAGVEEAVQAVLVGLAVTESIKTGGPVDVQSLLN